jgi:hypothetical protein
MPVSFILNIKTPACGANVGTDSTVNTGKSDLFPKRPFIKLGGYFTL